MPKDEKSQDKIQQREEFLKKFSWDEYVKKSQADVAGTEEFFRQVEENDRRRLPGNVSRRFV